MSTEIPKPIATLESGFGLVLKRIVIQMVHDIVHSEEGIIDVRNRKRLLEDFINSLADDRRHLLSTVMIEQYAIEAEVHDLGDLAAELFGKNWVEKFKKGLVVKDQAE